jgi:hypothetical protein
MRMISEANVLDNTRHLWNKPIPFMASCSESIPYPVDALPPIIHQAVTHYHRYGQQPVPLIACSALANVSLACQSHANVARDRLLVSPTSLYFIVCCKSGERKSGADQVFGKAIRQWEQAIRKQLSPHVEAARALHEAWRIEKNSMLMQIRRAITMGFDTADLKELHTKVVAAEPQIPLLPMLFFEDTTAEAFASSFAKGWPSSSIWSDEGGIIVNSPGMQNNATKFVAMLNRMWDGNPFIAHRKTSESYTIANRRLTISIMLQPIILQQMLTKQGGINRQSGFLARCLIAYPESTMGDRCYQEPPESLTPLLRFHERITDCLNQTLSFNMSPDDHQSIPIIALSPAAKLTWIKFFNRIEQGLNKSAHWASITDFASKSAENAARMAALFHLFEGKTDSISHETMERAIEIMEWHLLETKRLLGEQPQSESHDDAFKLLSWIREKSISEATPRYLQQYSPVREKQRRDAAIQILIENHYIRESQINAKMTLLINPQILIRA